MGHALRKALGVITAVQGWGQAAGTAIVAAQAGAPQLAASSFKAALDRDWDDPAARDAALAEVLGLLERVEAFIAGWAGDQTAATAVAVARQIRDQDVDLTARRRRCVAAGAFAQVTAVEARLTLRNAATEIDRLILTAWREKLPVYMELPSWRGRNVPQRRDLSPLAGSAFPAVDGNYRSHRGGDRVR